MVLVGCSSRQVQYKRLLSVYKVPPPLHLKLIQSKGKEVYIKSLERALSKLTTKVRVQSKIIKAYEKDVKEFNKEETTE